MPIGGNVRSCGSAGTPLPAELDADARAGAMWPCSVDAHVNRRAWSMAPAPRSSSDRMSSGMMGKPAASDPLPLPGSSHGRVPDRARRRGERLHPAAPEDVVDLVESAVADVEGQAVVVARGGRVSAFDDRVGREWPRIGVGLRVVVEVRRGDGRGVRGTMLYGMLRSICRYACPGEQFASQSAEWELTGSVSIAVLIGWSAGNMR